MNRNYSLINKQSDKENKTSTAQPIALELFRKNGSETRHTTYTAIEINIAYQIHAYPCPSFR
ncbi:hypothetical protein LMG18101_04468 [Ralstonia flaminis]|uniref:Uncharacterized protein n=1 Tax=Ralstonia flaminis TaxID=3058597 RepID=A0ABN9JQP0_9RALS|nr:hypothetical protein LMG18101_04468 [Ralstonia sp. LMG 18101]